MANISLFAVILALGCWQTAVATTNGTITDRIDVSTTNETSYIEPLFLDLTIQQVLTNSKGLSVVEPWASKYIEVLREDRYGDAIWTRYHIEGDIVDDIIPGYGGTTKMTVLGIIEEDVVDYQVHDADYYAKAIALYATTSSMDQHTDVLDLLLRVSQEVISSLQARVTFSTSCSGNYLAFAEDGKELLDDVSRTKALLGDRRFIGRFFTCYLRVGPYRRGRDMSWDTTWAVGRLIAHNCWRVPSANDDLFISGASPENTDTVKFA